MQPRCDINEVLSALPELIEREREAEKLIAAAEQRAEQAEAELKQLREVVDKLPNLLKSCMTLFANGVNAVYKHNDVEEHRSKARETERQIIDLLNKLEAQAERGQE